MKAITILKGLVIVLIVIIGILCKGGGERIYVIKASLSQNPQEPQVRAVELFKQIVEEKS